MRTESHKNAPNCIIIIKITTNRLYKIYPYIIIIFKHDHYKRKFIKNQMKAYWTVAIIVLRKTMLMFTLSATVTMKIRCVIVSLEERRILLKFHLFVGLSFCELQRWLLTTLYSTYLRLLNSSFGLFRVKLEFLHHS